MKIKMTATWASPDGVIPIGRVIDVPEQKAVEIVGGGYAKYCGSVVPAATPAQVVTLDDMMYKELAAACRKAGVSDKGTKKVLRARLKALEAVDDEQPDENTTLTTPENTAVRT